MRIIGRRVRVGRRDELDLVGWDGDTLVFVEVKTRANETFGRPAAAVNTAKRRYLSRAALRYVQRRFPRHPPQFIRFDVVEVVGTPEGARPEVRHLKDVFPLQGSYRYPGSQPRRF
jgi:putative endonuclease